MEGRESCHVSLVCRYFDLMSMGGVVSGTSLFFLSNTSSHRNFAARSKQGGKGGKPVVGWFRTTIAMLTISFCQLVVVFFFVLLGTSEIGALAAFR